MYIIIHILFFRFWVLWNITIMCSSIQCTIILNGILIFGTYKIKQIWTKIAWSFYVSIKRIAGSEFSMQSRRRLRLTAKLHAMFLTFYENANKRSINAFRTYNSTHYKVFARALKNHITEFLYHNNDIDIFGDWRALKALENNSFVWSKNFDFKY